MSASKLLVVRVTASTPCRPQKQALGSSKMTDGRRRPLPVRSMQGRKSLRRYVNLARPWTSPFVGGCVCVCVCMWVGGCKATSKKTWDGVRPSHLGCLHCTGFHVPVLNPHSSKPSKNVTAYDEGPTILRNHLRISQRSSNPFFHHPRIISIRKTSTAFRMSILKKRPDRNRWYTARKIDTDNTNR